MSRQRLDHYQKPQDYTVGPSKLVWALWIVCGTPLIEAYWLPGSIWRVFLLRLFGARIGRGCCIKPGFRVKFPWRLHVGNFCWLAQDVWIDNQAFVIIGDRVCISQGAYICTGNHDFRSLAFDLRLGPITIASDVLIAARAVLAPGSQIGSGVVVSIASVVSGCVLPNSILRGNPALVVGQRW